MECKPKAKSDDGGKIGGMINNVGKKRSLFQRRCILKQDARVKKIRAWNRRCRQRCLNGVIKVSPIWAINMQRKAETGNKTWKLLEKKRLVSPPSRAGKPLAFFREAPTSINCVYRKKHVSSQQLPRNAIFEKFVICVNYSFRTRGRDCDLNYDVRRSVRVRR